MGSRGTIARNKHYLDTEYRTIKVLSHGEKVLEGNHKDPIWYMHVYTKGNLKHNNALWITREIEARYREILEDIGYDQW